MTCPPQFSEIFKLQVPRFHSNSAFTILELVIVVVIIAVLTSLALPRLGAMIEGARAAEAIINFTAVRSNMVRCYTIARTMTKCDTFAKIGMQDPSTSPNSHFTYVLNARDACGGLCHQYFIEATRNNYETLVYDFHPGNQINCLGWAVLNPASQIGLCEEFGFRAGQLPPAFIGLHWSGSGFYSRYHE